MTENIEEYKRRSPVWNAEKLQTPAADPHQHQRRGRQRRWRSKSLIKALKAEGKEFEYEIYEDVPGGHSFDRLDGTEAKEIRLKVYRFLARYLRPGQPDRLGGPASRRGLPGSRQESRPHEPLRPAHRTHRGTGRRARHARCTSSAGPSSCENYRLLDRCLPAVTLFYAVKTNPHEGILETLKGAGAGFDVASRGEIMDAVNAGANPREDLIFADTVKDPKHIAHAFGIGLDDFTFDNRSEITQIARHAPGANVHVRIMVSNKGSVAHLSKKFGAEIKDAVPLLLAARDQGLSPRGVSFHVGSQCLEVKRYVDALDQVRGIFDEAAQQGLNLEMIDIGGGFPVRYENEDIDIEGMCGVIDEHYRKLFGPEIKLVAEPGRVIVGDAVILVTKVISEVGAQGKELALLRRRDLRQLHGGPALPDEVPPADQHHRTGPEIRPGRSDLRLDRRVLPGQEGADPGSRAAGNAPGRSADRRQHGRLHLLGIHPVQRVRTAQVRLSGLSLGSVERRESRWGSEARPAVKYAIPSTTRMIPSRINKASAAPVCPRYRRNRLMASMTAVHPAAQNRPQDDDDSPGAERKSSRRRSPPKQPRRPADPPERSGRRREVGQRPREPHHVENTAEPEGRGAGSLRPGSRASRSCLAFLRNLQPEKQHDQPHQDLEDEIGRVRGCSSGS